MTKSKNIIVIGAGFSGLASSAILAKKGYKVKLIEKNDQCGGRARIWKHEGFIFDMGPSWYWMPEVFENFYKLFGKEAKDFYDLKRLEPSYRIYYGQNDFLDVPSNINDLYETFEKLEKGSAKKLKKFLDEAKYKYETGMNDFVWKTSDSITEFFDIRILQQLFKINLFGSVSNEVRAAFKHPHLVKLLEFPVLFLGATPQNTPGLYSLMNYADLALGTWYPMGGMNEIVKAIESIAKNAGVEIILNEEVKNIVSNHSLVKKVVTSKNEYSADAVISANDYAHTDLNLLDKKDANYDEKYWDKRAMSPSSLLFYVGLNKKLNNVKHHNLFFDEDFEQHAYEIYTEPKWPNKPLFYTCIPSVTDASVAPVDHENLFFLVPLAPGLEDSEKLREEYFDIIVERFEKLTGNKIKENILFKRSYAMNDFKKDYHSYKGNAYGLANTLLQTAFLKPKMKSKNLKNLFYAGQLTVPGPGVPPSIISGQVAAREIDSFFQKRP